MRMSSKRQMPVHEIFFMVLFVASVGLVGTSAVLSETGTDFAGTVLTVDATAGKLGVKKDGGGTRFTFVVTDKTQFGGPGLTGLKDVKKGDSVTVTYVVTGSQYIAQKVTAKSK
jgi:hypothetical protein